MTEAGSKRRQSVLTVALIRFGFRLLYNELAWTYDVVSWLVSLGKWRSWQFAALPFLYGETVLEIAHGPGHLLRAVREEGYRVTGIDLSKSMGRIARRRILKHGLVVPIVRGSAQALPFCDDSFHTIVSTFPTEFIVKESSISDFARVLKPGGRLVIVFQARLTGRGVIVSFLEWLYAITGQRPELEESSLAVQEIKSRFSEAGLQLTVEKVILEKSEVFVAVANKR